MSYPLVLDLAADKIPVAVTCRVLGFSRQAFYAWRKNPVSQRDWDDAQLINAAIDIHGDDPEFGYRFIAGELPGKGHRDRREPGGTAVLSAADLVRAGQEAGAGPPDARRPGRPPVHRGRPGPRLAHRHHRAPDGRGQAVGACRARRPRAGSQPGAPARRRRLSPLVCGHDLVCRAHAEVFEQVGLAAGGQDELVQACEVEPSIPVSERPERPPPGGLAFYAQAQQLKFFQAAQR